MLAPWQPLLEWWFGWGTSAQAVAEESTLWFGKHHDAEAHAQFGELVEQALAGGLDEWQQSPQGWLPVAAARPAATHDLPRHAARLRG